MEKAKCNKCDERGYIKTGPYSSKSCECGWAIQQQEKMFEDVSLRELVTYMNARQIQKGRPDPYAELAETEGDWMEPFLDVDKS